MTPLFLTRLHDGRAARCVTLSSALLTGWLATLGCDDRAAHAAITPPESSSASEGLGVSGHVSGTAPDAEAPELAPNLVLAPTPAEPLAAPDGGDTRPPLGPIEEALPSPPPPPIDFVVTRSSTGLYPDVSKNRRSKLGYARRGATLSVRPDKIPTPECTRGWFELAEGGAYVCSAHGTTNKNHSLFRFPRGVPDIEGPLPYTYLRNSKHGTPLYRSVPSPEALFAYEPYLLPDPEPTPAETAEAAKEPAPEAEARGASGDTATPEHTDELDSELTVSDLEALEVSAPEVPWWQRENIKETLHEVTLEQIREEADDTLFTRLVRGFYIAADSSFEWNGRNYARTTRGLIAPKDRFWRATPSDFKGVELTGAWDLPVAWVYGRKDAKTFDIDVEKGVVKSRGTKLKKFSQVHLTGRETSIRDLDYSELIDGSWIRTYYIRETGPGPVPEDLAPGERWIDVNIKEQTLVAYEGATPVYATLVSSGRRNKKVKELDHTTPIGEWRVREKHLTATMDGNGSAAGELPYSIEDVPYVMYYYKSYALHAAFWHGNYGVRMSHGCVNLSPQDSKRLFFFAEPRVPDGWHGVWSSPDNPGTRVVVHDGTPLPPKGEPGELQPVAKQ